MDEMFGRYHLPLLRKLVGIILVVIFVWNLNVRSNQFLRDNFGPVGPHDDCWNCAKVEGNG